mmetsp:Transcript_21729/g.42704  ORF Transcript_21729/g.42704 Transcript_21729/m.42704 type:complete len:454 (-) Transcript_21729:921-2282(-)
MARRLSDVYHAPALESTRRESRASSGAGQCEEEKQLDFSACANPPRKIKYDIVRRKANFMLFRRCVLCADDSQSALYMADLDGYGAIKGPPSLIPFDQILYARNTDGRSSSCGFQIRVKVYFFDVQETRNRDATKLLTFQAGTSLQASEWVACINAIVKCIPPTSAPPIKPPKPAHLQPGIYNPLHGEDTVMNPPVSPKPNTLRRNTEPTISPPVPPPRDRTLAAGNLSAPSPPLLTPGRFAPQPEQGSLEDLESPPLPPRRQSKLKVVTQGHAKPTPESVESSSASLKQGSSRTPPPRPNYTASPSDPTRRFPPRPGDVNCQTFSIPVAVRVVSPDTTTSSPSPTPPPPPPRGQKPCPPPMSPPTTVTPTTAMTPPTAMSPPTGLSPVPGLVTPPPVQPRGIQSNNHEVKEPMNPQYPSGRQGIHRQPVDPKFNPFKLSSFQTRPSSSMQCN